MAHYNRLRPEDAESLPCYRQLAQQLSGKLACTRPVFDRGLLPFKLVIGQSGVVVKPKLLFSFGVSGAVNHVTGFSDAGCISAVNKDSDAAIFSLQRLWHCRRYGRNLCAAAATAGFGPKRMMSKVCLLVLIDYYVLFLD